MFGNIENFQKISKTNIEATTEAFGVLSKTTREIATELAEYSKRSFENNTKAMEKMLGNTSLDKAIDVQSEYARSILEDYTAQVTKLGQLYANLAKDVLKRFEAHAAKAAHAK
jgi:hypothetical protein